MSSRPGRVKVSVEDICRILNIPWSDEYKYPYRPEKMVLQPIGIGKGALLTRRKSAEVR